MLLTTLVSQQVSQQVMCADMPGFLVFFSAWEDYFGNLCAREDLLSMELHGAGYRRFHGNQGLKKTAAFDITKHTRKEQVWDKSNPH